MLKKLYGALGLVLILVSACTSPVSYQLPQDTGDLSLIIDGTQGRTILPDLSDMLATIEIDLTGPGDSRQLVFDIHQDIQIEGLETGQWTVEARGFNSLNQIFSEASTTVDITEGQNSLTLWLEPRREAGGTLNLDLLLPAGHPIDEVEYQISDLDTTVLIAGPADAQATNANVYNISGSFNSGYYYLEVNFYDNSQWVTGLYEVVWILDNIATVVEMEVPVPGLQNLPSAPINLFASYDGGTVNLSWTDTSSVEESYEVWAANDQDSLSLIATLGENAQSYQDIDIQANSLRSYEVIAVNTAGSSSAAQTSIQIPVFTKAPAPTISPASGSMEGPLEITISGARDIMYRSYIQGQVAGSFQAYSSAFTLSAPGNYTVEAYSLPLPGEVNSDSVVHSYELTQTGPEFAIYVWDEGSAPNIWAWFDNDGSPVMDELGHDWNTDHPTMEPVAGLDNWWVWELPQEYLNEAETTPLLFLLYKNNPEHSLSGTGWYKNGSWTPENPDSTLSLSLAPTPGFYPTPMPLSLTVSSTITPVAVTYSIDGGQEQPYSGSLDLPEQLWIDGFTISFSADNGQDNASIGGDYAIGEDPTVSDFNQLRIYQIMVEAFIDGDESGFGDGYGPSHHNGDLQGVIDAIPYIKGLGMNAIWLTPVFDSNSGDYRGQATGYFADDFFNVEPQFGGNEKFGQMVSAAHNAGLFVILDGVFGHHGAYDLAPSPKGGHVPANGGSQWYGYMVDYNQPGTLDYFTEVATYWIEEYGIDGWRLDQAYQVNSNPDIDNQSPGVTYWKEIREAVEAVSLQRKNDGEQWGTLGYMVGEIWKGENDIRDWGYSDVNGKEGLHSNFDFPLRYRIVQTLATEEHSENGAGVAYGRGADALAEGYNTHSVYPEWAIPNGFISNHDLVRFGDLIQRAPNLGYGPENQDYWKRHQLAIGMLGAYTGPITLMYGDEWGEEVEGFINKGDSGLYDDHAGRSSGKISGFTNDEQALIEFVKDVNRLRDQYSALWGGTRTNLIASGNQYADLKVSADQQIVFLMNIGTNTESFSLNVGGNGLLDLMDGSTMAGSGSYSVQVPALSVKYLLIQ